SFTRLSPEAQKSIARIDTHTYLGDKRKELRTLAAANGKNLWMSEVDGGDTAGVSAGEMGAALALARRIITDLNGLGASAWILWQLIGDHSSTEGMNGNRDSGMPDTKGGYWGVAVADHDRGEIVLTKKYWAFWQFTHFIRPGMRLLRQADSEAAAGTGDTDDTGVTGDCLAAYRAEDGTLVIIAVNYLPGPRFFTADISAFLPARHGRRVSIRAYRTSGSLADGENARELGTGRAQACRVHGRPAKATTAEGGLAKYSTIECGRIHWGRLKARLSANSITSFVISPVKTADERES
ncbi:MAG: hypothetical protein J6Y13_08650, partial [Treponema sp.]|nr:hypothetical protein [Treponema sp.]